MSTGLDYSPSVLQNQGAPCRLGDELIYVRFTNRVLCAIEEKWGSIDAWAQDTATKPASMARDVLAIVTGKTPDEISDLMDGHLTSEYGDAIGVAWSLASGVDPTVASTMVKAEREIKDRNAVAALEAAANVAAVIPGSTTSEPGSLAATTTSPSGTRAPRKRSSPSKRTAA